MSAGRVIFTGAMLWVGAMLPFPGIASAGKTASACAAPVFHELDFWIGDWDTFDTGKPDELSQARNHVTSILGGCVLLEHYTQTDGLVGESFTIYDASRKRWHQSWVTNRGSLLVIEGRMEGKRLVMYGDTRNADGQPLRLRAAWWPVAGGVRELAETSADAGKSWNTLFDITFRPHRD